MALDLKRIQKPARKLRKLLKKMKAKPSLDQVHDFRTNSRQMEATLQAFGVDQGRTQNRLLKSLSRLRKRAGKVRDMDVLTAYAASVDAKGGEQECAVQILEYLGARRRKQAKRFNSARRQHGSKLRRALKRAERKIRRRAQNNHMPSSRPATSALELGSQLASLPRLNRSNLHPFRLKVKELRNIMRLAAAPDQELVDALGNVKDAIGEWHDWEELLSIARKILDHGGPCKLIRDLENTTRQKYGSALSQAEQLRQRYLGISNKKHSFLPATTRSKTMLRAAIKLAA